MRQFNVEPQLQRLSGAANRGRLDFHLHSYASNITDYWASNSLSIPESYSDPIETYHVLKSKGMDLVTLTDHNSIDGVKEILDAGYDDVFISSEITTTFPEDGCNIHVTVANVTESQFREIRRLRKNVYEMVAYVDELIALEGSEGHENRIAYFMTHPLMSTQNRAYGREGALSVEHLEKALLLFNTLEIRNGTRGKAINRLTKRLLKSLTPGSIERLADKHGIEPKGETPWLKGMLGGSDDHSGINPGETWTEFGYVGERPTANDLVDAIRRRDTKAGGAHGGPVTLAHAVVKLLYDGQTRNQNESAKSVNMGGPLNQLLKYAFEAEGISVLDKLRWKLGCGFDFHVVNRLYGVLRVEPPFEKVLTAQASQILQDRDFRAALEGATRTDEKIFRIISELLNRMFAHYVGRITGTGDFDVVQAIKGIVSLLSSHLFVSLPYYISYNHQSSDKLLMRDVHDAFELAQQDKLLLVTDTFFDVNGVSRTIRRMLAESKRRGIKLTVVTCLEAQEMHRLEDPEVHEWILEGRLRVFESILNVDLPEYKDLQVRLLPFLELLQYAQERGFTKVQISTPGPIGLVGLMVARILQLETSATYHTSFPEYVESLTGDISLEAFTWKYMLSFYQSMDEVVVPSRFIADLLHERGLRNRKLLILDRWVDLDRFHPQMRDERYFEEWGLLRSTAFTKFVYVGRVSLEKNLDVMAKAFRWLSEERRDAHLIVIGDGPYRNKLEKSLAGLPVTFTGMLTPDRVAGALASADVMLFPSTTDTWGNAPLEAQACGLPVVVTDKGGPQELFEEGRTGLKVEGGSAESLVEAMEELMNPQLRARMGQRAREFVEENHVTEPFSAILDSDAYRRRAHKIAQVLPMPLRDRRHVEPESWDMPEPGRRILFTHR